ncbi:MAG: tryptophan synthase subunit alpha [Bacteroidetes bacterium]|nr:tryptophan synthase subunit alpha [Bacteroidota bacterium]
MRSINRITSLFERKKENILSIYFTAGFPELSSTENIIAALQKSGADMLEIGIPFSDPIADGPVIQQSNKKAIENGMTLQLLFEQLKTIRSHVNIPIILMGYLNPVYQMGIENFLQKCTDIGIDGVIIPDLPAEIYKTQYQQAFHKHNIFNVFLITPKTKPERIKYLDGLSEGFLYLVSSSGTTGKDTIFHEEEYQRINDMKLNNPLLIGFGIHDRASYENACKHARGAIVGSAFIKALEKSSSPENISSFIHSLTTPILCN